MSLGIAGLGRGTSSALLLVDCSQGLVNNTTVVCKCFQGNLSMKLGNDLALEVKRQLVV